MRVCSLPDCDRPHRARGLCSKHWKQQYGKPTRYAITCVICGKAHMSARPDGKYCSDACKAQGPEIQANLRRARESGAAKRFRARQRLEKAARGTTGRTWVAGNCDRCGTAYVAVNARLAPRFCSDACRYLTKTAARRAILRGARVERYSRVAVFERDDWTCHLCGVPVDRDVTAPDPMAPTIDHLTPLALGGADAPDNVATAHFLCNSIKSDRQDDGIHAA